jgi:glycosyltransferase involved in cell wall biosynthesis
MNIALYHPWLKSSGGAEKVLLEILERSSHDVTLYTLFYDEDATFAGFREHDIDVVGSDRPPRGFLDKALRFGLGSLTVDLPLADHDTLVVSEAGLGSLATLRNHSLPVYCYCHTPLRAALPEFHGTYRDEISLFMRPVYDLGILTYDWLERRAWRYFDGVMANSGLTKRRIMEKRLAHRSNTTVVNPGVNMDAFTPGEFDTYFLYPSRFRRYKRQHLAIEAFRAADIDDFNLVLAGSAQEQDYVDELRDMAADEDNIAIKTDVAGEEWTELFENAYSILFLAENEDWGIVPLEGMAAGKPVIAVNEGGYTEAVDDEATGFLVDADPDAIAEAMWTLVEDTDMAQTMGTAAREHVRQYTWARFIDQFDERVAR